MRRKRYQHALQKEATDAQKRKVVRAARAGGKLAAHGVRESRRVLRRRRRGRTRREREHGADSPKQGEDVGMIPVGSNYSSFRIVGTRLPVDPAEESSRTTPTLPTSAHVRSCYS